MTSQSDRVPGMFTLVLHTHLPWLAHHGRWPVGEEWLYQSWAASYLPLFRVLHELAGEGRHGLLTLGMTPVVNAQLDDPYCLDGMYHWLANWGLRALEAASVRSIPRSKSSGYQSCTPEALRAFGIREKAEAERALGDFATLWRHGGSPLLRGLVDAGTVELLGGRWPTRSSRCWRRDCASSRCARAWPTRGCGWGRVTVRPASGRPNARTPRAWKRSTRPPASRTSWSTARPCTGTPRWAGRSATPT